MTNPDRNNFIRRTGAMPDGQRRYSLWVARRRTLLHARTLRGLLRLWWDTRRVEGKIAFDV